MISIGVEIHKNKKEIFDLILVIVNGTLLFCYKENFNLYMNPFHIESIEKFMTSDTGIPAAAIVFNEALFNKNG
jgi:hypothetical protein